MRFRYDGPIPILELDRDPFGHAAFAFGLFGLPGVLVRGPSGRAPAIDEVAETCLELHEVGHWVHWIWWTFVFAGFGLIFGVFGTWWWTALTLYGYQVLMLFPPVRDALEGVLDHQQIRCKEELR